MGEQLFRRRGRRRCEHAPPSSPLVASQIHAVQEIIEDEGAGDTTQILVLNTADAIDTTDAQNDDRILTVDAAARFAFGE